MITIHDGSILVDGQAVRRVKVDSETSPGERHYYVTVDVDANSNDYGRVVGCNCQARGLNPTSPCKHMRAVVEQRLLQTR